MLNLRSILTAGTASLAALPALGQKGKPVKNETPNIVIILMDDMGYGDIGRTGAALYNTPNLDRLAEQGMQLTRYYCPQAVSSASRAGLLTGCYPNRVGISGALMPSARIGINPEETTIAEMLKTKGYYTGIIGKWHLGHHKEFLPLQNGFDEYLGLPYSNDMWPVDYDGVPIRLKDTTSGKMSYPVLPLIDGNDKIMDINTLQDQDKLTTLYTERAVKFINEHKAKPFFLYFAQSMVHVPLGVSDKFRGKSKQGMFGDVMMEVDWSVGEVMKALEKNGLDKNTIIIYTSDNGPWLNYGNHAGSAGGLREGKGTSWEGGQRVPCIMKWPGHIPAGSVCNGLACAIDIFPTLAEITGTQLPAKKIDGISILPMITGSTAASPRKTILYYYQRNSLEAVQEDYWKLILPHKGISYVGSAPGKDGWPGKNRNIEIKENELYDLRRDPGEQYNVVDQYPDVVARLMKVADDARKDLGDDIKNEPGAGRRAPGSVK